MVKCTDATQTEVHPSYEFTESEWGILLEAENTCIINDIDPYKCQGKVETKILLLENLLLLHRIYSQ